MEKKTLKLYGFKLKDCDMVNLFNESDLFGYEKESNSWVSNGFGWLVNNPTYIIDSFYDFFGNGNWLSLTESEFKEIVSTDEDLNEFDCQLLPSNYPIEKLFNKTVEIRTIASLSDIESYSDNATFTFIDEQSDYDEPMYYTKSELLNNEDLLSIGNYRIIY